MKKLRDIKIGWKYGGALLIVFILFGIAAAIVLGLVKDIGDNVSALEKRGDRAVQISEMGSLTRAKAIRVFEYLYKPETKFMDEFQDRREQFDELEAQIRENMDTEEKLVIFDKIVAQDQKLNEIFFRKLVPAMDKGDIEASEQFAGEASEIQLAAVLLLDELQSIVDEERAQAVKATKESQFRTFNTLIISMLTAVILGALITILISRMVSRNLNEVVSITNRIANGELDVPEIKYKGKDEIGRLSEAVNTMSHNLRMTIQQVYEVSQTVSSQSEELSQSAEEVKAGSQQVASTMQELASGSEAQATHASNLSSFMETFSDNMQEASSSGEAVFDSSRKVIDMTEKGSQLMSASIQQMGIIDRIVQDGVEKMKGLDVQSQEISKLVSVIKDIADQTNLLALNAAIEAARAGEQGRGFAVVADEVRKLAEEVTVSVEDITGIVSSIQTESANVADSLQGGYQEVEKGTSQIKTTGETFTEISTAIHEMAGSIQSITEKMETMAGKSQQMGAAIEEIATVSEEAAAGIEQTSASSQQTSSSMEEVSRSSEELSQMAEELNGLVGRFKL
ncbi:methyl-accepting chemotaxis protein [Cytobacillus firmus]|uniref:methyl-accepting chemotaxis protein n=1 Tax=Cytobacillus firmus TaxID=1399 RepID=UPI0022284E44|nr:methyl-accepting chemotaxis protein [Cytobacillus firmus]